MDTRQKLTILADAAKYDASCASSGSKQVREGAQLGSTEGMGICHSFTPDGRCISLLKILLTNYCVYDCHYCVNRVSSDTRRARFSVEEVVSLTIDFYRRNYIEGLFLSSGIIQDADYTMEQLVAVARKLRNEHHFGGYIHLKTIPKASAKLIEEAGRWADRLSVNIELPTERDLSALAPEKNLPEIVSTMDDIGQRIHEQRSDAKAGFQTPPFAPAGQSTQMIVGATDSPDAAVLETAASLYADHRLRRVYYSAYSPIPHADARLPGQAPPLAREHRLYQADWLLRFYGFELEEIVLDDDRNLSLDIDPKLAWALAHREFFPVDVNRANREQLLRVPGLGVRNVNRILQVRRHRALRVADLKRLRVCWRRANAFLVMADHNPGLAGLDQLDLRRRVEPAIRQLKLFESATEAHTGEL